MVLKPQWTSQALEEGRPRALLRIPWLASPPTRADWTLDYNFQANFWGAVSSNHPELMAPFFEGLNTDWFWLVSRMRAAANWQVRAGVAWRRDCLRKSFSLMDSYHSPRALRAARGRRRRTRAVAPSRTPTWIPASVPHLLLEGMLGSR